MFRKLALSAAAFVLLASTTISSAQQTGQEPAQDLAPQQPQYSLDSVITLVRANMQADRASVVASAMDLSPKDAPAFWQVYRDYESERARIDDGRVAVIKQYSESYSSLSDAAAKDMALKMIASDARLASVKKKYYKKFNRVLPAYMVTKFFQVDRRLDLIMDMKVEWSIPPLTDAKATSAN